MFWHKGEQKEDKSGRKVKDALRKYLMSQQGIAVDVLQSLKQVEREDMVEGKPVTMIRIFNPAMTNYQGEAIDVGIEDYETLDDHPELILYEGYYREVGGQPTDIHIDKK